MVELEAEGCGFGSGIDELAKANLSTRTVPFLDKRTVRSVAGGAVRPGVPVVVKNATTGTIDAVLLPKVLSEDALFGQMLYMLDSLRSSGGWSQGCEAEPVANPMLLKVLFDDFAKTHAYGLNPGCRPLRIEHKSVEGNGSSLHLVYLNSRGQVGGACVGV